MAEIDWDQGLGPDLLELVARGQDDLKATRGVSKSWKTAYEGSVTKLGLGRGPMIPPGGVFALRFNRITHLDLSADPSNRRAELQDEDLDSLQGTRLTSLSLHGNLELSDAGVARLEGQRLTHLDLGGCRGRQGLSHMGLLSLQGMPLKSLSLSFNRWLTGSALALLLAIELPLTRLQLRGCVRLRDADLVLLQGLPLEALDLGLAPWGKLTPAGLAATNGLPLRELGLAMWHGMRRDALRKLHQFPQLARLSFSGCDVDGCALEALRGLRLTNLDLSHTGRVRVEGLRALRGMPLATLKLQLSEIDARVALQQLWGLPLTALTFSDTQGVSDVEMLLLRGLPLRRLVANHCIRITDAGMRQLGGLPLTDLCLEDLPWVTDAGVESLRGLPLECLRLTAAGLVRGAGFGALRGAPLVRVELCCCEGLDEGGLEVLLGLGVADLRLRDFAVSDA